MMKFKIQFIFLCALVGLNSACSRLDLAYDWADTYIASKVDDYFDTSYQQNKNLKKSLQQDLAKMKDDVLPGWIQNAKQLEKEVAEGTLNENKVASVFSVVMSDVVQFSSHFCDTAVNFISSTNPKQLQYFATSFHKRTEEDLDKWRNTKRSFNDVRDKYYKYFNMFLGSLTSQQKDLVEKHLIESPFPMELRIKNKEWVFNHFIKQDSPEKREAFVKDFYAHPENYDMPEYQAAYKLYQKNLEKLISQVLLSLTSQQKKELRANLLEKVAQLEKIRRRS